MNTSTTLYIVRVYCEDATVTVETNSAEVMLENFDAALEGDVPCEVICGTTGEILASHDCGCGEYVTEDFIMVYLEEAMS